MQASNNFNIQDLGTLDYHEAWRLQEELRQKRSNGEIPDTLLLLEHPPVYTLGKRDCSSDFLVPLEMIQKAGIDIVQSNRGGRITYHGPGQLVGYFIFSIEDRKMSVGDFVCRVEEICLRAIADFGVQGTRDPEHPGVWIGRNKIAAIGLHFSRGVSQHGFALNVAPKIEHYQYIIPCGIQERSVTSLELLLSQVPTMEKVKASIKKNVQVIFQEGLCT